MVGGFCFNDRAGQPTLWHPMPTKSATLLLCLVAACGGDDGGGSNNPDGGAPDACTDPSCTPTPDAAVPTWAFRDINGVPNLDDDNADGTADWVQPLFATDDDASTLVLPAMDLGLLPAGGDVQLTLTGDVTGVKVYQGGLHVVGAGKGPGPVTFTPTAGADTELQIEFGTYGATAELTLDAREAGGTVAYTTAVTLQAAPLIMNHHLQPAEHVWAVAVQGNEDFIAGYQAALGAKFTSVSGSLVQGDVWIQDEFEFATLAGDQNQRIDVVIDSIRDRGLDAYADDLVRASTDGYQQTWGNPQAATSYDSFGNLEATPPFTVNGVEYPFGKIYYGRVGNQGMSTTLGTFLAAQEVQAPFTLPTSWLCVGHVDEFSSFVPDPSSPKGFKLVISDTGSAWTLLESLSPTQTLPYYGADHGYATVGALLADANLRALNDDLQADYLEPIITKFKTELGLTDADIIRSPSLFEGVGCGTSNGLPRVAALIPGMVNLIVANVDSTTTHLFTADPFFRSTTNQAADPIIAAFTAAMPAGMQLHYLDNWDTYHMGLGEVHCGTNVRRTPMTTWWTTAQHLLGGN